MPYLLTLAWILGITYSSIPIFWLLVHPFANYWRSVAIGSRTLLAGLWLVSIVALGVLTASWRLQQLYDTPFSWLAWLLFVALGISIYHRVGRGFGGDNLIGRTELEPQLEQRLVTTGLHARIRHPIYLAHLLMLTAWTLGSGLTVLFVLWATAILTGFFMVRAEDAELERRFGDAYREYKRRVPAVLPL